MNIRMWYENLYKAHTKDTAGKGSGNLEYYSPLVVLVIPRPIVFFFFSFGLWGYWHCGHSWRIVPASGDSEDDYGEADGM
jgi:hypothetical protein